jgi:hypothetical protein
MKPSAKGDSALSFIDVIIDLSSAFILCCWILTQNVRHLCVPIVAQETV